MTPFAIAHDPPAQKSIPDLQNPEKILPRRAATRFSLSDQHAIGKGNPKKEAQTISRTFR